MKFSCKKPFKKNGAFLRFIRIIWRKSAIPEAGGSSSFTDEKNCIAAAGLWVEGHSELGRLLRE